MTKKITKRERFEMMLNTYNFTEEEREFIEHEIELLEKKKSGERKPTKTQIENDGLKAIVLEVLKNAENPMTVSDIIKAHEELSQLSTQKVSPLLTKLVDELRVVKTIEKRRSYFSIAE